MSDMKDHKRVNDILLGPLERPALQWLSARMPVWITPDVCTAIGVLGTVIISLGYILSNMDRNFLWLASFGFVVNWFGDSLDGTLARYRHIERPKFGFFIDHTIDTFCQIMIFFGMGLSPYVSFNIASLALVGYLALGVLAYVRIIVAGEFKLSYGKLGPTEIRVIAILLNTSMYFIGIKTLDWGIAGYSFTLSVYDFVILFIALLLFGFFLNTAWKQARLLAKLGE